jgi:hypothetical protein
MSSALTIAALRKRVSPVKVKYQCQLRPFAQANLPRLEKIVMCYNENPVIMEWIAAQNDSYYKTIDPQWGFSGNPSAIEYMEAHLDQLIMRAACENPKLSEKIFNHLLETVPLDLLAYDLLSSNPSEPVVDYMLSHPNKIDWDSWCQNSNPRAVALLKQNWPRINWSYLSSNECDDAVKLLELDPLNIDFNELSRNSNARAVKLLLCYPQHIHYGRMSANTNATALKFLMQNKPDLANWYALSKNPAAMAILEANPSNISFISFWENPAIFEMDFPSMNKDRWLETKKLLLQVSLHPDRIDRLSKEGLSFKEIAAHL